MENNLSNNTHTEYPQNECIHSLFEEQVERTPDAVAVVFEDQQLTYQQLNAKANQLAHYLQSLGVKPEELVGICVERSIETVIGILSILKVGAAYVPLDPAYPPERIAYSLYDSQVKVLLTNQKHLAELPQHEAEVVCLDRDGKAIANYSAQNLQTEVKPNNLAYVIYTSGSTGKPKGVLVEHGNVVRLFAATQDWYNFDNNDVWTLFHSYAFDFSVWELWGALIYGGKLVVVPYLVSRSPDAFYQLLEKEGVTVLNQTPSAFLQLIQVEENANVTAQLNLRYVIFGGEALELQSLRPWFDRHGDRTPQLVNMYGITETTVHVTYRPIKPEDLAKSSSVIGCPIPDLKLYLLDRNLQPVPIGVVGEMYVGGAGVARGYLNRQELTKQRFISDPFSNNLESKLYKTGDLGRYWANGELEYLGRIDNQVKIRGFRIELGEIETVLTSYENVSQTVAIVREDRPGNKIIVAYVVPRSNLTLQGSILRQFLQDKLPDYMIPSAFVILESLPLTDNGKVDRRALPAPDTSKIQLDAEFVPPSNPTEELLTTIWAKILGANRIGINDDFFELGGHSLLATQVISRCRQAFGVEIPLQSLFEKPTIATLAQTIIQYQNQGAELSPHQTTPKLRGDRLPLSFAQQRLWFLDQLEPNSSFYNLPDAVKLKGELNIEVLQKAIDAIVAHHEAIRTNYQSENGTPIQVIAAPQSVELPIIDLREYEAREQETQVQKLLQQQSQRPFNLASDLMLRACLLKLAPQEHILLVVMHHIASDGWSMSIFWEQLTQLYRAFQDGKPNPLAPLPIQYADYAVWQREWLSQVQDKQLDYWLQQLAGANPVLELPTDRPRPAVQTYRGASQSCTLPQSLSQQLQQLCRNQGVTLYMTLLAAFQTLLYRYSRQSDIIVGSPIAGRNRTEVEELIGFFVNTLVLRTDFSGNPSFEELLQQVRSVTLDAYTHQDLPFEKLVDKIRPERSLSYNPLFQVMFVLQNQTIKARETSDLTITPLPVDKETALFDLSLSIKETSQGLMSWWEYNTDLFDAATIERMTAHFQTLLEGIVANPQQQIARLPLLTPTEQQQLLTQWNDTHTEYPQDKSIHFLFEEQVERTPDAVAVAFEGQQLTYQELNHKANQLAHYLQKLGVKPDVLVGICTERSVEMMVGLLGILKAGGAYLPLDPAYPSERLAYMISDAETSVILTQDKWTSKLPEHQAKVICLDLDWKEIAFYSQENPTQTNTGKNIAYLIYTSGSTGNPKGVMISHRALISFTQTAVSEYKLTPSDRVLQFASINFDAAVEEIYPCLSTGATLILRTDDMLADLQTFFQACEDLQLTVLDLPTAYWHQLVAELGNANVALPKSLRLVIIGGERVLPEPVRIWQEYVVKSGKSNYLQLINTYGPTETTVSATLYRIPVSRSSTVEEVPIGRPLVHLQTYILDSHLQPVPIGVPGELHLGGDSLAKGYLNRPELTAEKFISNPFSQSKGSRLYKTGDLTRYLPDGNIEFLGRIDNQVKIRGFRIELGEIELVLNTHPQVQQVVTIAREDVPGNKRLVAYVVAEAEQLHSSELRSFIQQRLPNYMVPSAFVFLDTMPLTPNGKVDRRALPAPDNTRQEPSSTYVAPQDKLESQLIQIWEQVLNIQPIGVEDNFFDLGGSSLQAVTLFAQIEKQFGKKLPLATLFQSGTVAKIAQIIRSKKWLAPWESLVPIQPNGNRPPLFYIHGGGGNLLIYRDLANSLGSDQPVYGLQPRGLDGKYVPFTRLEDMAAYYLAQIRKLQPNGPYFLAGLSIGGTTAWEIAQLLQARGEEVSLLALFDTVGPGSYKILPPLPRLLSVCKWVMLNFLDKLSNFPKKFVLELKQTGIKQTSIKILEKLRIVKKAEDEDGKINREKMQLIFDDVFARYKSSSKSISSLERWINSLAIFLLKCFARGLYVEVFVEALSGNQTDTINDTSEISEVLQKVQKANITANRNYVPSVYSGKVILFRASDRPPGIYHDPKLGWGELAAGGMEIYEIPGDHTSIMQSSVLSEKLKTCLGKAQTD